MKSRLLYILILLTFGCNQDDMSNSGSQDNSSGFLSENFGTQILIDVMGQVVDRNELPIEGASVMIDNHSVMTDSRGFFKLEDVSAYEKYAYLKVIKNGYISTSRIIVPKQNGTSNMRVMMLDNNVTAVVNSGEQSTVELNDVKVILSGDFVDENEVSYSGQVEVLLHYLKPNEVDTFLTMPGDLIGRTIDGQASGLETYGMILVNLYSPNGNELNLAPNAPAMIEFPIASSQLAVAPETIPLWSFDEENGYWKEEGLATKVGNKYTSEVNHFSWWNVDDRFPIVTLCYNLIKEGDTEPYNQNDNSMSNIFEIEIIRESTGQSIEITHVGLYEDKCSFIPSNESLILRISLICDGQQNIVHEETFMSSDQDQSIDVVIPNLVDFETNLIGVLKNCENNLIEDGYVSIWNDDFYNFTNIQSGELDTYFYICSNFQANLTAYDAMNNYFLSPTQIQLSIPTTNLDVISVCDPMIDEDDNVYTGNVSLITQQEVNDFGSQSYTKIIGNLTIGGFNQGDPLLNLTPLNTLMVVDGSFRAQKILNNFDGLQNLIRIDGNVIFEGINNPVITFNGLQNLQAINGNLDCFYNVIDFTGLDNLSQIDGNFWIGLAGQSTQSFNGLESLNSITGQLNIQDMENLESIQGLQGLVSVGSIFMNNSYVLPNLNGLENLTNSGNISIWNCDILSDFCGLQNLFSSGTYGNVSITGNGNGLSTPFNPTANDIAAGNCSQ